MDIGHIHWYGHDAFRIEDAGKQIYFDPWKIPAGAPKADVIFVSHDHYDHFSQDDIALLRKPGAPVACPPDTAAKLDAPVVPVSPGAEAEAAGLKFKAVPAYNVGKKFHPKANGWVGYIVTLSDGTRIYHAGDTDRIEEMDSLEADIALLPVSGTYVMTASEAAEAARAIKPKIAIPMHYDTIVGTAADALAFKERYGGKTVILTPER